MTIRLHVIDAQALGYMCDSMAPDSVDATAIVTTSERSGLHQEPYRTDVIVLDVEMPRMDGITFLKKIMAERPTPDATFKRWTGGVGQVKPTVFYGAPTGFAGMLGTLATAASATHSSTAAARCKAMRLNW